MAMMDLAKYFRKFVVVKADNGRVFRGRVIDHLTPEDNEVESIVIRNEKDGALIELVSADIRSINIIKQVSDNS